MHLQPPPHFDEQFLAWFRAQSEAKWKSYQPMTFQYRVDHEWGGCDFQQGTRWLQGLSNEEIVRIEQRWSLRFPPDYRLFLSCLHTLDRPMTGADYDDEDNNLIPATSPSFTNWTADTDLIRKQFYWLLEGILFDVRRNRIWYPDWGKKPITVKEQEEWVSDLYAHAPRLIPVRYPFAFLLVDPCQSGNPIFSLHQTDIVVWHSDLYHYLCHFAGIEQTREEIEEKRALYEAIPFWGSMLCW